jgi:hypothetical protein
MDQKTTKKIINKICQNEECVLLRKVEPGMRKMIPLLKQCLEMENNRDVFMWSLPRRSAYEHGNVHGALKAIITAIENPLKHDMGCFECQEKEWEKHYAN